MGHRSPPPPISGPQHTLNPDGDSPASRMLDLGRRHPRSPEKASVCCLCFAGHTAGQRTG